MENKSLLRRIIESDPVVVRGLIVAALGFGAMVLNMNFAEGQTEAIANGVISLLAIVSALWARGKVVPSRKVVNYMPQPDKNPGLIVPGEANGSVIDMDGRRDL